MERRRRAAKAAAALKHDLTPIVCVGEHLEVREAGNHVSHNVEQLHSRHCHATGT